jgi:hypothetical protein
MFSAAEWTIIFITLAIPCIYWFLARSSSKRFKNFQ